MSDHPPTPSSANPSRRRGIRSIALSVSLACPIVAFLVSRPDPDVLAAVAVDSPQQIQRRTSDTKAFEEALEDVDYELGASGPRDLDNAERSTVVDQFTRRGHQVIEATATILQESDSGALVIEFDVVPTGFDKLDNGLVLDRCQAIALGGFDDLAASEVSCFDPDYNQFEENNTEYHWSYGCKLAYPFTGSDAFGKRKFQAAVALVDESPGVIFTLESNEQVLVRPTNGLAVYTGPPANTMTIYTANGEATTDRTDDCA